MARKRTQRKTARVKRTSVKSYYGKFSPLLIIVIVVVVALLGGAGYFLFGKNGGGASLIGSKSSGALVQKVSESDFSYIDDELLRKHMAAQANQTSFKVISKSSGRGGESTTEYDMKGDSLNYRVMMTGEGLESDMIIIGDTTYIKDYKDGKWWKQTVKPGEENSEVKTQIEDIVERDPEKEKTEFAKLTYNNLGQEACGNLTCYKYEEFDANNDTKDSGRRLFWFDTKDFLLRKDLSEFGEFSAESEYSYDGIKVKAPSPTKDVPEGRNIYEYIGGAGGATIPEGVPSQEEIDKMMQQYQENGGAGTFPSSDDTGTQDFDSGDY